MGLIDEIRAIVLVIGAVVAAGCAAPYGGPVPLRDFAKRSLTVSHNGSPQLNTFTATLESSDTSWCEVLGYDAFARLNGQRVPLFAGEVTVIPPQGDDGGVVCAPPSVTMAQFPSDLAPPWTLEIGDSSETVSVTFGPESINPVVLTNPVLTSAALTVTLQRQPGDTTVISGQATLTGPGGMSTTSSFAEAGENEITFPMFTALWPSGPVAVAIELDDFSPDQLVDCQDAPCTLTPGSGVHVPTTTAFTVQHTIPSY